MDKTEFRELLVMLRHDPSFRRMVKDILLEPEDNYRRLDQGPQRDAALDAVPPGYMTRETARKILDINAAGLRTLVWNGHIPSYGERKLLKVDEFSKYVLRRKNVQTRARMLEWLEENGHVAKAVKKEGRDSEEETCQLALAM